jgi:hypothetical protein
MPLFPPQFTFTEPDWQQKYWMLKKQTERTIAGKDATITKLQNDVNRLRIELAKERDRLDIKRIK